MKTPAHLATYSGELINTETGRTVRPASAYCHTYATITTGRELRATLRAGEYCWPGGYPMYFITSDGAALSFEAVRAELRNVLDSIRHKSRDGWQVVAVDVNYEDGELVCEHTGKRIPSTYAETETEPCTLKH